MVTEIFIRESGKGRKSLWSKAFWGGEDVLCGSVENDGGPEHNYDFFPPLLFAITSASLRKVYVLVLCKCCPHNSWVNKVELIMDRRKTCSMPLETQIYALKKQTICVACGSVLSPEILSKFKEVKTEFCTVLPNCGVEACLKFMEFWLKGPNKGWICKRPRKQNKKKQNLKRKAAHVAEEKRLKKKRKP